MKVVMVDEGVDALDELFDGGEGTTADGLMGSRRMTAKFIIYISSNIIRPPFVLPLPIFIVVHG